MFTLLLFFSALIAYGTSQTECSTPWQCKTCGNASVGCTDCYPGQGLSMELSPSPNNICRDCGAYCTNCVNRKTCTECFQGYGPLGSVNCSACIAPNCLACPREVQTCTQCKPGYGFFSNNNICGACSPYCEFYGCYKRYPGNCDQCDPGYGYIGTSFVCGACSPYCAAGCNQTGAGKCDKCDAGYEPASDGSCAPTGQIVSGATSESPRPTPTRSTMSSENPATRNPGVNVSVIQPAYGPMAGGTVITIVASWTLSNISISAVYFGSNLKTDNLSQSTSANGFVSEVFVISPPIRDISLINQPLLLTLQLSPDLVNVSSGKFFTYKPNPTIIDVYPRTIPLSGGIRLTVTGSNLASASDPVIHSSVIIVRNNGLPSRNDSYGPCYQSNENGTQMICLSPPVYIPQDFLLYLFGQTDQYSDVYRQRKRRDVLIVDWLKGHETVLPLRSRFKRSLSIFTNQTYALPSTEDTMQIFMDAVFDGSTVSLDSVGNFQVLNPPNISCGVNSHFDSKDSATITITGTGMSACCGKTDYTVRIGNGFCNVTDLTDNELKCEPPKDKPQQTEKDMLYCGENFVVFIYVGNKTYGCSCLTYADNSKTTLIIIIVATVGSALVISIVVVVISIFVKRSRTQKKRPTQKESIQNPLADGRGVMMMMTSRQPNDIGDPESYETGGTVLSTEGYLNRIPGQDYNTSPPNQSDAYHYHNQIDLGYVRPIEDD